MTEASELGEEEDGMQLVVWLYEKELEQSQLWRK